VEITVPLPACKIISVGIAIGTVITAAFDARSSGVAMVQVLKAYSPIGFVAKFNNMAKIAVHFGNGEILGQGQKIYKNGDIKNATYQRKMEGGIYVELKLGNCFGGLTTIGFIRDVVRRSWVKIYSEPKNMQTGCPNKVASQLGDALG